MNQFTVALWGDEAFSAILSMKSIPEIIKIIMRDTSPPLYNILEHLAFQLWGTDEIIIRGLSFAYYLVAVFFVYEIGVFLWNKKTGLLAALLTFFNPFFFIYAFEGRMYSLLAAGVVASMYFFLKLQFAKKINYSDWYGYILASLIALYTHHFAIFPLFIQGLWFLAKPKKLLFKAFFLIGVGYLPWLIPLYRQVTMVGSNFWLGTPTFKDLLSLIGDYLGKGQKHDFALPAMVLVIAALILRKWAFKKKDLFLLSWFSLPILLTWTISQVFQSIFFNRYLIYSIPAAMLLVASQGRKFSEAILVLILGFYIVVSGAYFVSPTKDPFNLLAAYVRESKRGDDFVIHGDAGSHQLWESKYYGIPAPIYVPNKQELPFFVGTALMEEGDIIDKLPPKARRIGVITKGEVAENLLPNYTKTETVSFGALRFTWFQ
jgi:uncharacterized membrane protein